MRQLVSAPRLITPRELLENASVLIEDGKILEIGPTNLLSQGVVDRKIAVPDGWICPGFIDLHVHGSFGYDTMDASVETLEALDRYFPTRGVTAYVPTTVSESKANIDGCLKAFQQYSPQASGAHALGIHLEGPYLNTEHRGAQDPAHIRPPSPDEYRIWLDTGAIRVITMAPELQGAERLIRDARALDVRLAAGHTGATFDEMARAVDLGLTQATHTFNGMRAFHHREPGVLGAVLTDPRIYAQVIADGIHVHPAAIRLLVKLKGWQRVVLITDAIRAAGLGDGTYMLGNQQVTVKDAVARVPGGSLAGSILTMDEAVRNMMEYAQISLQDAVSMATLTPSRALGLDGRKGVLERGADADIVILDAGLHVQMTMVGGEVVFEGPQG